MTRGLSLVPRPFAPEGSLAAALASGTGPVALPTLGGAPPSPRGKAAGLPAEAFGTTSPETRARLERVLAGDGLAVTTGQQPVLFLGPMYVLYKILTAIAVAEELEAGLGVPVVPIFWVASDDHDWDEVGRMALLDRDHDLHTLVLEPPAGRAGRSVGPSTLGPAVDDLHVRIAELLPESDFSGACLELLRTSYESTSTVSEAFTALLPGVLAGREFAWIDSGSVALRQAATALYARFVDAPEEILTAMTVGAARLEDAGFVPPIASLRGALPLFYDDGRSRERLYHEAGGFRAGRDGDLATAETWRSRLEAEATAFSPNVTARPVLESSLIPVAATVLGPGELAYWSQLLPVFEACGVPAPAMVPRASWTVVEARIARVLDKIGLDLEELADGGDGAVKRVTEEARPESVDAGFGSLRRSISSAADEFGTTLDAEFPGLKAAVGKTRKGLFDTVDALERQVDAAARQRQDTTIDQIRRAAANLFPGRKAQERVLSPLYFLARYGSAIVDLVDAETRARAADSLATPGTGG